MSRATEVRVPLTALPPLATTPASPAKERRRFLSIRTRLVMGSLGLAVVLLAFALGMNWILLQQAAHHQAEGALESISSLLAYSVAAGLDFDSPESVREALAGVFQIEEVRFAGVSTPDGKLYEELGDWPSWHQQQQIPEKTVIERRDGLLLAHTPIRSSSSEVIGVLHLGYSLEAMRADLRHGLLALLLAGLFLTLGAMIATRRFGARLTAPILALATAARNMAEGRFPRPLEIRRQDEVGTVALAFNEMATRLEDSRGEIERQNRELEAKVRDRTAELRQKNIALAIQNEQVLEMSRLKSSFLANMSHELRTPLNGILALSELLREEIMGPLANEEQRKQVSMIYQSGSNLLRLINDILDLSKIEAGRMEIRHEKTEVQEVLRASALELESLARGKQLEFRLEQKGEGAVWVDADRVRQVFVNLVGNAIKFTEQGRVEIQCLLEPEHEQLTVRVRDTGMGIAPEDVDKIFQEFRQVDGSASRRFGGTGLGLAICRRLVRMMGGEIWVESELGKGSCFAFQVPATQSEPKEDPGEIGVQGSASHRDAVRARPPEESPRLETPITAAMHGSTWPESPVPADLAGGEEAKAANLGLAASGRQGCVLIVDDDEILLEALVRYLTREGFSVNVANSGQEALRQLDQEKPDLMVLDLMMPGMSGFQLLETLTQGGGRPRVPVLVHTAKDLSQLEWLALERCVDRIFRKGGGGVRLLVEEIHRMVAAGLPAPEIEQNAHPDIERNEGNDPRESNLEDARDHRAA